MPFYFWNSGATGSAEGDFMLGDDGAASTISGLGGDDVILGDVHGFADPDGSNGSIGNSRSIADYGWTTSENALFANSAIPHVIISNTTMAGEAEYFHTPLTAGQTITVDVDFGGGPGFIDTVVEIRNSAGSILASNDNSLLTDGGYGSFNTGDPFLSFTAPSDGTYYISIHPAGAATFSSVYLITINVSITGHAADTAITISNDILSGGDGNDQLLGAGGDDQLGGDAGNDQLDGGTGNDILNGGLGADRMAGDLGNDLYYADNAGDTAIETSGGGTDSVRSTVSFTLGANVENLTLIGGAEVNGTGNALANGIAGNHRANILNGAGGADRMTGAAGNDLYYVDNAGDLAVETAATGGTDSVRSTVTFTIGAFVENLTLIGTGAINGTGNSLANSIAGNTRANILNGAGGADTMSGGAGNDLYYVDNSGDSVVELAAGGTDSVRSTVGFTLGANVENLTLIGSAAVGATGNALANTLTGNNAANLIHGEAGNDTMRGAGGNDSIGGGAGNDNLGGGAGADHFLFNTALNASTNVDQIVDFSVADDSFALDEAIFTALSGATGVTSSMFRIGTAALDADDRIIHDSDTGRIYYDADGNGAGAQVLFAVVVPDLALTHADFVVLS